MNKIVRTALTFALLAGGYLGYARGFALVEARLVSTRPGVVRATPLPPGESPSAKEATALATRVFGKDHWAAHSDKRYYNVERGYWMYWDNFDRPADQEGKRIVFSPFAVIWKAKDDEGVKVIRGDRAVVDFDKPFDLLKPGPKPNLVYARIEGIKDHVLIQDDKGTAAPGDDLIVTMPYAEYFEKELQIRCDQEVHLTEPGTTVQGSDLVINLRPSDGSQRFSGADTLELNRDVIIRAEDVGKTGILPGAARPEQQIPGTTVAETKTPVEIQAGRMVLRLAQPAPDPLVGPPAPPPPTIAEFYRNVVVKRGAGLPDQINGDTLTAVLIPNRKRSESQDAAGAEGKGDMLGGLSLYEARVEGHAVWLQSEAERLKVRGNELIYRKPGPDLPDESYFRADQGKNLFMERLEVDETGALKSQMIIWAADATLRGTPGGGGSTIVARGPGWLEQRSGPGQPVERSARWRDEMVVDTAARPDPGSATATTDTSRTYITLKGDPVVDDPAQVLMASRDQMVVCLKPRPPAPADPAAATSLASTTATGAEAPKKGNAYQVEWITATGDVHMVTPEKNPDGTPVKEGRRTLNARRELQVVFDYPEPAADSATASARTVRPVSNQAPAPAAAVPPPAADVAIAQGPAPVEGGEAAVVESKEPQGLDVAADLVWARVVVDGDDGLGLTAAPGTSAKGSRDVRQVRLRGDVRVQQDPAEGQDQGLDLTAAAVDVENDGPGRLKLNAQGAENEFARLVTPEMTIEGPKLGANQGRHLAWVEGEGVLTMRSEAGATGLGGLTMIADGKQVEAGEKATEKKPKGPSVIRWKEKMAFHGVYADAQGRPGPARAQFHGDVKARLGDDSIACQDLEAVMDRPVSFDRPLPGSEPAGTGDGTDESAGSDRPEVESVMARDQVWIVSAARDEAGMVKEVREIHGSSVAFVRPTGDFWVDDQGTVFVTGLAEKGEGVPQRGLADSVKVSGPKQSGQGAQELVQTRVDFRKGVQGQIGMGPDDKATGYREATFKGDIRVLRAVVPNYKTRLDHDRAPGQHLSVDSDEMVMEQTPADALTNQPEWTALKFFGDANARTARDVIRGDSIAYDSLKGLIHVRSQYRSMIQSQESVGQAPSTVTGKAYIFNPKTGQAQVIEPGEMQIFEPGSGGRFGKESPAKPKAKKEEKRPEPKLPPRSDIERKGFRGGA